MIAVILFLLLILLEIALAAFFIHNLKCKEGICSIIIGAAFLLGCCLILLAINIWVNGYQYRLIVNREKLEALVIDLDTTQPYEEWFCPDEQIMTVKGNLYMQKIVAFAEPYGYVIITLECFSDAQAAKMSYNNKLGIQKKNHLGQWITTKSQSSEYEYYFTKTCRDVSRDILFGLLPEGRYGSKVTIRYKNFVCAFVEHSDQRRSRIDEVIDMLLADYEAYKEAMNP
ncbi:MAG: hypothetical protein FWE98_06280 [Oscillospiraceae bacterium]|nr:hypothetical protein [Oscillospiraceae bacterium]